MKKRDNSINRIAELRKRKGLTLQEVGNAIGVGNNTISRYETGKREPKLETWKKLAKFFDVPLSYIQGEGYSLPQIQDIIFKELNTSYLKYACSDNNNHLGETIYDYLKLVDQIHPELEALSSFPRNAFKVAFQSNGKKIIYDQETKLFWLKYFNFIFNYSIFLSWSKQDLNNKLKLDQTLEEIILIRKKAIGIAGLTNLGKSFRKSNEYSRKVHAVEKADNLHLDLEGKKLFSLIPDEFVERDLHNRFLNEYCFGKDKKKVLESLNAYIDFLKYSRSKAEKIELVNKSKKQE